MTATNIWHREALAALYTLENKAIREAASLATADQTYGLLHGQTLTVRANRTGTGVRLVWGIGDTFGTLSVPRHVAVNRIAETMQERLS